MPELGLKSRGIGIATVLIIVGFFVAQLPFLDAIYRFHFDEKYYTDAAIGMLRHGDLLVPHYSDGSLRLRKPVLTYWVILSGFELGGVSYGAGRMGILLAATGVLAATALLARRLFGRPEAGLVAVALLVADHEMFTASWRLNPDALLTLWITVALTGFALHAFSQRGSTPGLLLGYLGAGLALATKGFLGVAAAIYGLAFIKWGSLHLPGTDRRTRIHWLGAAGAILLGGAWYAAMAMRFGPGSLLDFLKDQAGLQPGGAGAGIAGHPPRYLLATLGDFLLAFVLLFLGWRVAPARIRGFWNKNRRLVLYALGWFALIFFVFAFGRVFRPRYLFPAHPFLAALLGAAIVELLDDLRFRNVLSRSRIWAFALAALLGLLVALIGLRFDWRFPLAGAVLFLGAILWRLRARTPMALVVGMCVWIFGVLWSYDAFLRPVFGSSPSRELAQRLESVSTERPLLCFGVPYRIQAQLAVLTAGRYMPRAVRDLDVTQTSVLPLVLVAESAVDKLPADLYQQDLTVHMYRHVDARLFLDSWGGVDRDALLAERRRSVVLALPLE